MRQQEAAGHLPCCVTSPGKGGTLLRDRGGQEDKGCLVPWQQALAEARHTFSHQHSWQDLRVCRQHACCQRQLEAQEELVDTLGRPGSGEAYGSGLQPQPMLIPAFPSCRCPWHPCCVTHPPALVPLAFPASSCHLLPLPPCSGFSLSLPAHCPALPTLWPRPVPTTICQP